MTDKTTSPPTPPPPEIWREMVEKALSDSSHGSQTKIRNEYEKRGFLVKQREFSRLVQKERERRMVEENGNGQIGGEENDNNENNHNNDDDNKRKRKAKEFGGGGGGGDELMLFPTSIGSSGAWKWEGKELKDGEKRKKMMMNGGCCCQCCCCKCNSSNNKRKNGENGNEKRAKGGDIHLQSSSSSAAAAGAAISTQNNKDTTTSSSSSSISIPPENLTEFWTAAFESFASCWFPEGAPSEAKDFYNAAGRHAIAYYQKIMEVISEHRLREEGEGD